MSVWLAIVILTGVDVAAVQVEREDMDLLTDGKGHYLAVYLPSRGHENYTDLYYGDGKVFYQVRAAGGGYDTGHDSFEVFIIDRRFPGYIFLEYRDGKFIVTCGETKTEMTVVKKSKKMLAKATFKRERFEWTPFALSRDDDGTYFYVDRGRFRDNRSKFRVFIGPRGRLEQKTLINIVEDSEGAVFATKSGTLSLVLNRGEYWWIEKSKDKRTQLTIVPVMKNLQLIHNELGVYAGVRFGSPCDDM